MLTRCVHCGECISSFPESCALLSGTIDSHNFKFVATGVLGFVCKSHFNDLPASMSGGSFFPIQLPLADLPPDHNIEKMSESEGDGDNESVKHTGAPATLIAEKLNAGSEKSKRREIFFDEGEYMLVADGEDEDKKGS